MIMELREDNTKHYCNYYNIHRYFNGKHIYRFLHLLKNFSSDHNKKKFNSMTYKLIFQSHNKDYINII